MSSDRNIVDITYDDPRTGERVRERRIQEVPYEDLEDVRDRELAVVCRPAPRGSSHELSLSRPKYADDDYEVDRTRSRRIRERNFQDDEFLVPYDRRNDVGYYDRRSSHRQGDKAYWDDESDDDSSRERRRRRGHRRARSERDTALGRERSAPARTNNDDDDGFLWYSMRKRKEGNIFERNFDSSYDGLIAGVAGAAIGAMTAKRFAGPEKSTLKALGGAVAGAAAFNVAENRYRIYTEEREERREDNEAATARRNQR